VMDHSIARHDLKIAVKEYAEDGVTVLRRSIDSDLIRRTREEILGVVEEVCGRAMPTTDDPVAFSMRTTEALWDIISHEPAKRNLLYTYAQRVPALYELASVEPLRRFASAVAIHKPSVREAKVQIFLPWEKLFLQDCHQDINTLDSTNSVTFWIPLHPLTDKTAVRYWVGSHKEGPVRHDEVVDEDQAVYLERIPLAVQEKYPRVRTAVAIDGDVIAINRLTFHQSPRFEDQLYARWSVVVRYDDIAGNGLYSEKSRYAELAPNAAEKMGERSERIRAHLSRKPQIDWRERVRRAGEV